MAFGTYYGFNMTATLGSASVSLQRAFELIYLMIPTMPSSTALDVYASVDGSNYYQIRKEPFNTSTAQASTYIVAATAGANGGIIPIPAGFKYYKFVATDSAPTTTLGFNVVCGNE